MSALGTLSESEFSQLISANEDGSYTVHFRGDYVDKYGNIHRGPFNIQVKEGVDFDNRGQAYSKKDGKWYQLSSGDMDVKILESALMKQFGYDAANFNYISNSQNLLKGTNSYKQVYGADVDLSKIDGSVEIGFSPSTFTRTAQYATAKDGKNYFDIVSSHLNSDGDLYVKDTVTTALGTVETGTVTVIPTAHAYRLESYDAKTDTAVIVNPHDSANKKYTVSGDLIRGAATVAVPANAQGYNIANSEISGSIKYVLKSTVLSYARLFN